nr:autotransporter outer membrane beta-barrel domain-containing protein [Silvimonas terrae]
MLTIANAWGLIDSWLLYGWQRNQVSSDDLATQNYHSNTFAAAVETGYTISASPVSLTPFAQFIWNRYLDSVTYEQDTQTAVETANPQGYASRLGLRLSANNPTGLAPFVSIDWQHDWGETTLTMNSRTVTLDRAANRLGLKAGAQYTPSADWRLHLQLSTLSDKQFSAELGLRHRF